MRNAHVDNRTRDDDDVDDEDENEDGEGAPLFFTTHENPADGKNDIEKEERVCVRGG